MSTHAAPRGNRRIVLRVGLLVLAIALVVVGTLFTVRAHQVRGERADANRAVVDPTATAQVIGQVSNALNSVLSYDYQKPEVAQAAAKRYLTGDAPGQYKTLFDQLQSLARGQKLTLVAKVSTAGVVYLHGDHARLLVFVDQESTRASDGQSSISAAQVRIGATKHGDVWQIDELKPI